MSIKEDLSLIEKIREMESSLSMTIKINIGQINEIVVADLTLKYKSAVNSDNKKNIELFKNVLLFYLDNSEFEEIKDIIK